jgi:hypothetical protein
MGSRLLLGEEGVGVLTHVWNVARNAIFTARCQGLISRDRFILQNPILSCSGKIHPDRAAAPNLSGDCLLGSGDPS